jgi:hypothetical protein
LPVFEPLSVTYTTLAKDASTKTPVTVPVAEPPAKAAIGHARIHNTTRCLIVFTVSSPLLNIL